MVSLDSCASGRVPALGRPVANLGRAIAAIGDGDPLGEACLPPISRVLALVRGGVSPVRGPVPVIGDLIPLVGDPVPLVGGPVALVRGVLLLVLPPSLT